MEYCYYHPDRSAVARCLECGKPLCGECRVEFEGRSFCRECALKHLQAKEELSPSRPWASPGLGVGEVLTAGFKLLVNYPLILVPFVGLLALDVLLAAARLNLLSQVISFFATPLVVGMTVKMSYEALRGTRPELKEGLDAALERYGSLLWASILYGLAIVLGFIALFIPGLIFYIRLILYPQAIIVERASALPALREVSWELTRGSFWRLFLISLIQVLASIPAAFFGGFGALLINSWIYSSLTVAYLRLRGTKERSGSI
ncbi:MAG: hypothetical protein ACE5LQ_01555 [Candidatus Bipolaricaulia bacterium]